MFNARENPSRLFETILHRCRLHVSSFRFFKTRPQIGILTLGDNLYRRKYSPKLGTNWKKGIPIEVIPISYTAVKRKIESCYGGEANLRMAVKKAVSIGFCSINGENYYFVN